MLVLFLGILQSPRQHLTFFFLFFVFVVSLWFIVVGRRASNLAESSILWLEHRRSQIWTDSFSEKKKLNFQTWKEREARYGKNATFDVVVVVVVVIVAVVVVTAVSVVVVVAIVDAAAVFEKETKHDQPNFSAFSFYINVQKLMLSFERGDVKCNLGISKLWVPN